MGGDNFKKSSSENPHVSRGNTILSRLNNEWELAKIRHDAAAEYFDELCEMVEFEINTHHNNRNYFMLIEIEFPENLNQFVPRPRQKEIDFLMQKTWSDKFQEFMRKQEINCHLIKSNHRNDNLLKINYTANRKKNTVIDVMRGGMITFTYDFDSLKFNRTKLNSDYLMSEFDHRRREFTKIDLDPIGRRDIKLERTLESVNGNYINNNSRSAIALHFLYTNSDFKLEAMLNCSLSIERLPDGYFLGLTDSEKESLKKTTRQRYLLTWPKHVYVEQKYTNNDFDRHGKRWK